MSDSEEIELLKIQIARLEKLITSTAEGDPAAYLHIQLNEVSDVSGISGWEWISRLDIPKKGSVQNGFLQGSYEKVFLVALYTGLQHAGLYEEAKKELHVSLPDTHLSPFLVAKSYLPVSFEEDLIDRYNRVAQLIEAFPKIEIIIRK